MYRLVDGDGVLYGTMEVFNDEDSCEQGEAKMWFSGIGCLDRV